MDLKPCPFCGSGAVLIELEDEPNRGGWCVECPACKASSIVSFPVKDDARPLVVEAWNRRSDTAAHRSGAIAALEALPCSGKGRFEKDCLELENLPLDLWCPRCRALAALKKEATNG